jgi:hypothetical protein
LSFDGVDDFVSSDNYSSPAQNISNHTISAWIKLNENIQNTRQYILVYGADFTGAHHWIIEPDNSLQIGYFNSNFIDGFMNDNLFIDIPVYNEWFHLSASYNGDSLYAYINGNIVASNIQPVFDLNSSFIIGSGWEGEYWGGSMSSFNVWDKELTSQEIQDYMICGPSGGEHGLVGYWGFNEGSGNTAYDLSGNANDGVINGAIYSEDIPENNCLFEETSNIKNIEGFSYSGFFNSSYYFVSHNSFTWLESDSISNDLGAHLVTISNENENNFVSSLLNGSQAWIGLADAQIEGEFNWVDNTNLNYENWADTEPSNSGPFGNEDYVIINTGEGNSNPSSGFWNDADNNTELLFVLEIDAIYGCLDSLDYNYNPEANTSDQSCLTYEEYKIDSLEIANEVLTNEASIAVSSLQQALDTWNTTIDLSAGWNMFGYGCPSPINIAEGLSNHTDIISIVKDNNGNLYMPEFGFNGIGDFTPGFGYQIKVTEAIEGFSLCDWYVNDIPEDNIVSLQEENASLQGFIDSVNTPTIYQVGDYAEGGIVYYVDLSGEHGLVAAINNVGEYYEWGCSDISVSGADEITIGSGFQNTMDIINQDCTIDSGVYTTAAEVCYNLQENGYDDWYLPSSDELLMMSNISDVANFIGLNCWIWSSTEFQNSTWLAWVVCPLTGEIGTLQKYTNARVRPIRSF